MPKHPYRWDWSHGRIPAGNSYAEDEFVLTAASTIGHMIAIDLTDHLWWVPGLRFEVETYREAVAELMWDNPQLKPSYEALFAESWREGIKIGLEEFVRTSHSMKRIKHPGNQKDIKQWIKTAAWEFARDSRYSFEHAFAFDPRFEMKRPDGTRTGRGMIDEPDCKTWPLPVARQINAAIEGGYEKERGMEVLGGPVPLIEDPGRMARDSKHAVYDRILPSDQWRKCAVDRPPAKRR